MAEERERVEALVIGAGAAGAAFTWSLSQTGIQVMCLEQGGWVAPKSYPTVLDDWELHRQHVYHLDPNFRRLPADYPVNDTASPIAPLMYNAVGGSTIHWSAHFPRFRPSDFRVRTLDGVADDWPLTYAQLEPFFDLNDRMMGIPQGELYALPIALDAVERRGHKRAAAGAVPVPLADNTGRVSCDFVHFRTF